MMSTESALAGVLLRWQKVRPSTATDAASKAEPADYTPGAAGLRATPP